jgi:hypothetical protein
MGLHVNAPARTVFVSAAVAWATLAAAPMVRSQAVPVAPERSTFSAAEARQRAVLFLERRGLGRPGAPVPAAILLAARAQHAAMTQEQTQTPSATWQPVGPIQVSTTAWGLVTGRITSLAVDPSDTTGNTLYVGTTGGGVWKSTTAAGAVSNASFTALTDDLDVFSTAALTSLSIGAITVQPGGTGVVLAGTGDPNDAADSWYGAGILRSTDGGATWALIVNAAAGPTGKTFSFLGNAIAGFAWSTTSPNEVVAAVSQSAYGALLGTTSAETNSVQGLYVSQDTGATWQLATIEDGTTVVEAPNTEPVASNAVTAVVWNPMRQSFYAAVRYHGYYSSPDGITWTRLANQPGENLTTAMCPSNPNASGSSACPIFRGALAVQPATGDMFALTVDVNNLDQGLWQDVCNSTGNPPACASTAVEFGTQIADQALDSGSGTIAQGSYDLWLAAVPSQQDTLLFAGTTDIWKCSLANSCVWRNTTNTQTCAAAKVAPSQHAVESTFGASGLLYFGNDGGLWRSTDAVNQQAAVCSTDDANHFQNLNGGLGSLAEVESFSEDPNTPDTWLAALGALGSAAPEANAQVWDQVLGGEGNVVAIDPVAPLNWYATSEFGVGINRCTEGLNCDTAGFGSVAIGEAQVDNDVQTIPAPWLIDPENDTNMILGTCRVWQGPVNGGSWSQDSLLSGILDGDQSTSFCNGNAEIRSLAAGVNSSSPLVDGQGAEQLYAGMAGALDGGGLAPGHFFTAAVNADSQATTWTDQYASTVSNDTNTQFDPGEFDISSIYADPHDTTGQTVYVTVQGFSTTLGGEPLVYRSTDAGAHWTDITLGLPNAPANSVVVDPNDPNIVYVATDTGVYITQNVSACAASACWNVYGSGLPNAPAIALMTYNEGSTQELRVATYGRGIWETNLATAGIATTTASADPASLSFTTPQQEGTESAMQTVTVTNEGQLTNLNVSSVTTGADFPVSNDTCSGQSIAPGNPCTIQVAFDPTQTGGLEETLTFFANVTGGQLTVPLSGKGLAPGTVELTPPSLTFAGLLVGTESAPPYPNITISNTGGEPVTLNSEVVSGDFAIAPNTNTCGGSLAANSGCTVSIVFAPTASGTLTGTLTVTDSLGTQTAQLSGTGLAPATDTLSPLSLTFAAQQVGTASAAQLVTLTNNGDELLTSINVVVTAVTGDFHIANNCGSQLQGHGNCTIAMTYVPSVVGPESGTLTVSDQLRSQTVTLAGTGVAPPGVSATPVSIPFGNWAAGTTSGAQTVTVTNNGGYALTGLAAATTANFAIAGNNCPATLGIGAECQIGVTFTAPAALGPVTGTLTIGAANLTQPQTVKLSGAAADFSMSVSGSSPSPAVIVSGQSASFTVALAGLDGSAGTVTLTCSGAPQNATCSFGLAQNGVCPAATTASAILNGENASTANVCISTGVAPASAMNRVPAARWKRAASVLALLLPLLLTGPRRRRWAGLLVVLAAILLAPVGCGVSASGGSGGGGSGSAQNQTPSGSYVLTVTGAMSNIAHSAGLNLTVQ